MRNITLLAFILFSLSVKSFGQAADSSGRRPNVLFIVSDDLNGTLNVLGKKGVITPNLDKLAQSGMTFTRAYCQSALCNPSRSSFLTGRRPHHLKIWALSHHFRGMYPRIETLPEFFKDNGYYSVGIGKIFHNWGQAIHGDPQSWSEPQVDHWGVHAWDWYVPGRPYKVHPDVGKGAAVQHEDVPDEAYLDGRIANAAVNKLRELRETPFFLAVGFWKPHLPYNAPKKYWDLYDRNNLPPVKYTAKVEGVPDIAYVNSKEARTYTDVPKEGPIPEPKKQELRHGYLADISYLDANIGKVLDELDRLNLTKNTIIVFLSDNGYHSGEQGQFGKWTNFEVGTRIPLIISAPGIKKPGKASSSMVELVDLYPTLVDLCHLPQPEQSEKLDGVSLKPILWNPNANVKTAALSQIGRPLGKPEDRTIMGSSIRERNFRYNIWTRENDGEVVAEELYDLSDDLYNAENVIDDPKYRDTRKKLYQDLKEMLMK